MSKKNRQKAVLVLGMHRSGTSALTAGLTALGFHFGHKEGHASEENPKGYFENQAVVQLNDKILKHLGYSWSNPFWGNNSVDPSELQSFVPVAIDLIKESYAESPCWGIKDPRVCLLLPFWEHVIAEAFDCDVYYVHALRHPLEVADSLKVRNSRFKQFLCGDTRQSILLWFAYQLCAFRDTSNDRNILISFDDLIHSPLKQVNRLVRFLGITPDKSSIDNYVNTFLTKGLKHHSSSTEILSKDYPELQFIADYYADLLLLKLDDEFNRNNIEEILAAVPNLDIFQSCCDVAAATFQDAQRSIFLSDELGGYRKQVVDLSKSNTDCVENLENIKSKLQRSEEQRRALETELQLKGIALAEVNKSLIDHKGRLASKVSEKVFIFVRKIPGSKLLEKRIELFRKNKKIQRDQKILKHSNIFDSSFYRLQFDDSLEFGSDLLSHYLTYGTKQGLWPNSTFDPLFYLQMYPDVKASGQNPLVHYLVAGKKEGRLTQKEPLTSGVKKIPSSPNEENKGHYFDSEFYQRAYPDIGGLDPLIHYNTYGRVEGRIPCQSHPIDFSGIEQLDSGKSSVLVVSHDASVTGGPTLCLKIIEHLKMKYNVITLLIGGGPQLKQFKEKSDFVVEPVLGNKIVMMPIVVEQLSSLVSIKFAIVNTVESRYVLPGLAQRFIPSICLMHEFASYIRPKNAIREVVLWASEVVFSTESVRQDAVKYCDALINRKPVIYPQGQCASMPIEASERSLAQMHRIQNKVRPPHFTEGTVIVLGAGTVELRKGVDLFLGCAARLLGLCPDVDFHFVWAGHGFDPEEDTEYSSFLQDQIERDGLGDYVTFVGELSSMSYAYDVADIFFLSSRLDPLPNVAIDAMFHNVPVICFENTGGIPDFLIAKGLKNRCVTSYLNITKTAKLLSGLINNPASRKILGEELKNIASKYFDMETYVRSLDDLAQQLTVQQEVEKRDCHSIENNKAVNLNEYLPQGSCIDEKSAVIQFVRSWQSGEGLRKPIPEFHPGIYAEQNSLLIKTINPFAHFLEQNSPKGPWLAELILPSTKQTVINGELPKTALHIHVFYEDLLDNIIGRLKGQLLHIDLFISVNNNSVAERVRKRLSIYDKGTVDIRVVPNRGRDIGPFITEFGDELLNKYELIGHVHTKKSLNVKNQTVVSQWFDFIMENLLGKKFPMASIILDHLSKNEKVGLVFPSDPNVAGWSKNKLFAKDLCTRIGINNMPETYFDFPVGTMFWARKEAIAPLLTIGFDWEDYPSEPLPYDGSMLHAIERLLPSVVQEQGYSYKMTSVNGVLR